MDKKKQFTLREVADAIVQEGISRTITGRWSVGFEEIQNRFGLDLSADSDAGDFWQKSYVRKKKLMS